MKFYFRDINKEMVMAWNHFFKDCADVEVSHGDIFIGAPKADAIVSPANSFGFMDGGIDYVYSMKFGWGLQERLQQRIKEQHYGEVPVGDAVMLSTNDKDYPLLISAPTMRIPQVVRTTVNAYLAFRAVLIKVKTRQEIIAKCGDMYKDDPILPLNSLLCPGLGTAVGMMSHWSCAAQMYEAYKAFWLGPIPEYQELSDAHDHHVRMAAWEKFNTNK